MAGQFRACGTRRMGRIWHCNGDYRCKQREARDGSAFVMLHAAIIEQFNWRTPEEYTNQAISTAYVQVRRWVCYWIPIHSRPLPHLIFRGTGHDPCGIWRGDTVGHPKHKASCHSRLFRVKCQHCGQHVYLYSCTCHSGRLLEENRPPWTPHDCLTAAQELEDAEATERAREEFKKKYSGSRLIKATQYRKRKKLKKRSTAKPIRQGEGLFAISAREARLPKEQRRRPKQRQSKGRKPK